jgi:hypothetical protein
MSGLVNRCSQIQSLLPDFVDGELGSQDSAKVAAHIALCADCSSEIGFLEATNLGIYRAFPEVHAPAELFSRIAQVTYSRPTLGQRLARIFAPAPVRIGLGSALAAAVLAAVVAPRLSESRHPNAPTLANNTRPAPAAFAPVAGVHVSPSVTPRAARSITTAAPTEVAAVAPKSAPVLSATAATARIALVTHPADVMAGSRTALRIAANSRVPAAVRQVKPNPIAEFKNIDLPTKRGVQLADRSLVHPRSLANGEAPVIGVPTMPMPDTGDGHSGAAGAIGANANMPGTGDATVPTSAHDVVAEVPTVHRAPHISLEGAGTGRSATSMLIQTTFRHDDGIAQNGMVPLVKSPVN